MNPTDTDPVTSAQVAAAPLPTGLRARLLDAMNDAAAEEEAHRRLEEQLRLLSPAKMPLRMEQRLCVRMCLQAAEDRRHPLYRRWFNRWVAAAAALVLFASGGGLIFSGNAAADTMVRGLVSRNIIETRCLDNGVRWEADGVPTRSYEVVYEDAFVLESAGVDATIVVRVPNRTCVEVEEEVL